MIARFLRDEAGTTALEYAVIASLISVAIMLAIQPIGNTLADIFGQAEAGFGGGA
jgi:pilus assembly protein Flp/PilA